MERNVPYYERHGYQVAELTRHSERVVLGKHSRIAMRRRVCRGLTHGQQAHPYGANVAAELHELPIDDPNVASIRLGTLSVGTAPLTERLSGCVRRYAGGGGEKNR